MGLNQSKVNKEINDKIKELENRIINIELIIENLIDDYEEMLKDLDSYKIKNYDNLLFENDEELLDPLINSEEEKSI